MIKSILKRIWAQRRNNTWLLVECFVVFLLLGAIVDSYWQYNIGKDAPKGFSIENVYDIEMEYAPEKVKGLSDSELAEFRRNSALAIKIHLESHPDVEVVTFYDGCDFFDRREGAGMGWREASENRKLFFSFTTDENYFKVFEPEIIEGTMDVMKGDLKNIWNSEEAIRNVIISKEFADFLFTSDSEVLDSTNIPKPQKMEYSDMIGQTFYESGSKVRLIGITDRTQHMPLFELKEYVYKPFSEKYLLQEIPLIAVKVKDGRKLRLEKFERGPYYLEKVQSFEEYKKEKSGHFQLEYIATVVFIFLIFNIFFGIFGSFWYRINQRTSEIGIRLSIGASSKKVMHELISEAILILSIASIPAIIVGANLFYLEIPLDYWEPISILRFIRTFTLSYLILAVMVVFGTWLPARRVMKIQPAIALKEE